MKKIFFLLAFTLIIFLSGCLTTLHPIFTEKDLVFKPELLGSWKTKNGEKESRVDITALAGESSIELPGRISSIKNKGYLITDKYDSSQFIAFLALIGKHLYFDYYPVTTASEKRMDEFYLLHFTKMHTPYRVEIQKNGKFELSQLEGSYLDKLIDEKKIRIRHEVDSDGGVVITASTEELQQYILKYGDDPEALMDTKTIFSK